MAQITVDRPLEKLHTGILVRLQFVMSVILALPLRLARAGAALVAARPAAAPVSSWRSTPLTSGSTLISFDPALAEEIGETKAIILQKVWDWMEYNRTEGKSDHCIDGQWYSYNSAREWRDAHFWYLSASTIKAAFQWLEEKGYVQRIQHHKERGDCRMWVTIPAVSRARIDAISAANTPDKKTPRGDKKTPRGDNNTTTGARKVTALGEKDSPTKRESSNKNQQFPEAPKAKQQQQPTHGTDTDAAVVVPQCSPDPESESGEHSIEGEGLDTTAVKAFVPHEQHHNDQPISKVPLKVLSPLCADLVTFGVLPPTAQRLADQYQEVDVRYVLAYSRAQTTLTNPPGFVVDELDTGKHGVLAARGLAAVPQPVAPRVNRDPSVVAWEEQIKRDMERMIAEDEAAERAAGQSAESDCEVNV